MKSNALSPILSSIDRFGRIRQAANVAVVVMVLVMVAAGMASYRQLSSQLESRKWVLHTYQVLTALQSQRAHILTADLAVQRYLVSNNDHFRREYERARADAISQFDFVVRKTVDNPEQQASAKALEPVLHNHFEALQKAVVANTALEKELLAKDHLVQISALLDQMQKREQNLLSVRSNRLDQMSQHTFYLIAAVSVLAVLFQLTLATLIAYWVRAQKRTEARLQAIITSMEEGLYQIDKIGNLLYLNPKAEALLGFRLEDIVGKHMHEIIHYKNEDGSVRPAAECNLLDVIKTGRPLSVTDVFVRKDGSFLPVELSSSPLVEDGEISGAVICFSDITSRKAVEKRMNEFYSIVSHELRTPLTSIRAALGLIEGGAAGQLTPRGTQLVQIGRQESERLVRLINDILDLKKIETGKLELDLVTLDVSLLIESTIETLVSGAHNQGVHIASEVLDGLFIRADKDRMVQVLTNLISNAVKFSGRGTTVLVGSIQENGFIRIFVKDQGPGIPENKVNLLFGMFQQVDSTDARAKGGTGLGLAISKSIVEAHGGTIGVETAEGKGSTFFFKLPVAAVPVIATPAAPAKNDNQSVLVIDDDRSTRELIRQQLEGMDLNFIPAENGREAVELARRYKPELIVLDVLLPEKSGFDVVAELRTDNELKNTPMIVYTAKDISDSERQDLILGPTVLLIKTKTTEDELLSAIKTSLGNVPKSP